MIVVFYPLIAAPVLKVKSTIHRKGRSRGKCARGACSDLPGSIREESAFSEYALMGVTLGEIDAYTLRIALKEEEIHS